MSKVAIDTLHWAEGHLQQGTWPRDDYLELLQLVIVWLGGEVRNFRFCFPGPDHHACWLSKAIYFLKLAILQNQFSMDEHEIQEVTLMSEFVGLFYARGFFECPLPGSAPLNDLKFLTQIVQYKKYQPKLAFACLQSGYRNLW